MPQPVVCIELRVEPAQIANPGHTNPQPAQPDISHPQRLPRPTAPRQPRPNTPGQQHQRPTMKGPCPSSEPGATSRRRPTRHSGGFDTSMVTSGPSTRSASRAARECGRRVHTTCTGPADTGRHGGTLAGCHGLKPQITGHTRDGNALPGRLLRISDFPQWTFALLFDVRRRRPVCRAGSR